MSKIIHLWTTLLLHLPVFLSSDVKADEYLCQTTTPIYDTNNRIVGSIESGAVIRATRNRSMPGKWLLLDDAESATYVDGERFITTEQMEAQLQKQLIIPHVRSWDPIHGKKFSAKLIGTAYGQVLLQDKGGDYRMMSFGKFRKWDQDYINRYQEQLSEEQQAEVINHIVFLEQKRKNQELEALRGEVDRLKRP
ncbi:MAG: hypothetical protein V1929_07115 [bacterium]